MEIVSYTQVCLVHQGILSVVKRVEFISDRMSYIALRDRWYDIIVLNTQTRTEDRGGDSKDSFCEELEEVIDHFPQYNIKILLGDVNAKLGREDIFKPTIGNEDSNRVKAVNFATSKI
jgi:hypothetical protein